MSPREKSDESVMLEEAIPKITVLTSKHYGTKEHMTCFFFNNKPNKL